MDKYFANSCQGAENLYSNKTLAEESTNKIGTHSPAHEVGMEGLESHLPGKSDQFKVTPYCLGTSGGSPASSSLTGDTQKPSLWGVGLPTNLNKLSGHSAGSNGI